MPTLDTNVILRQLLADDPEQSPRANRIMQKLGSGVLQVTIPEPVIFEVVFTLERRERHSRSLVRDLVVELMRRPGVTVPNRDILAAALDLHAERGISLVDAYICIVARDGDSRVISFDRGFDRIPGLARIEP